MTSRASLASLVVTWAATLLVASASPTLGADAAAFTCRDVASLVGLEFEGTYGSTVGVGTAAQQMERNMGNGAAVGDYDADGDLDVLLLGQRGHPDRLFRNLAERGRVTFEDVTEAAGVGDLGAARVAHFADLDGDGWLDLLIVADRRSVGASTGSRILRNTGRGSFEDVTPGSGFDPVGFIVGGTSLADVDGDGDLDVYITFWARPLVEERRLETAGRDLAARSDARVPGENVLYRNDGGFRFTDVTDEVGLGGVVRDSFTSVFADFDRDGDLDLFVAIDNGPDLLYQNRDGHFRDISDEADVTHRGNDMGVAVADLDSDGHLDLFSTNISDPDGVFGTTQGNALYMGSSSADGGIRFRDQARERGVFATGWAWGTAFVDLDLDADLDLVVAQGMDEIVVGHSRSLLDDRASVLLGDDGYFTDVAGTGCDVAGDQRALVAFDHDRDGDADLLMTQVAGAAILLEVETPAHGRLTVDLSAAGAAAFGAEVSVRVGERTTTQVLLAGGSYLTGGPPELYFGLGDAARADEVTVRWPDGATEHTSEIASGSIVKLRPEG